jgi:hypothetical protein
MEGGAMISNRRKLKTQTSLRGSTQRRRKLLNNHKKVLHRQRTYALSLFDENEALFCR